MRIEAEKNFLQLTTFSGCTRPGSADDDERVELVDGEIIKLNPGKRHVTCTLRATLLTRAFNHRACVSVQNPLVLDIYNEPKPDIVILKPRENFYDSTEPSPISSQSLLWEGDGR